MSRRPKTVREIYSDSISINLASLKKDMLEHGIRDEEIAHVISIISDLYYKRLDEIEKECDRDVMALEAVPSPLDLLVRCITEVEETPEISKSSKFLARYSSAWESWM